MTRVSRFATAVGLWSVAVGLSMSAHAQGPAVNVQALPNRLLSPNINYIQREQIAPEAVKSLLTQFRARISAENLPFTVGFTTALERPLEQLASTEAPKNLGEQTEKQNMVAAQMNQLDLEGRQDFLKIRPDFKFPDLIIPCRANAKKFDWRSLGKVTPVKNQQCGNCWAYASMSTWEASNLIRNNQTTDSSEQYIVSCATYDNGNDAGTCGGGWHAGVFEYLISHGDAMEVDSHDSGTNGSCSPTMSHPYRAVSWGYVPGSVASGYSDYIPTVAAMKDALCEYGPLTVAVLATGPFQAYTGGTFKENLSESVIHPTYNGKKYHAINHDVTLIGWDDSKNAWLIKNSWGTGWGETGGIGTDKGYMWIDYNSNNLGLGAAWVRAKSAFYILPRKYYEINPHILIDPGPLKPINKQIRINDSFRRRINP